MYKDRIYENITKVHMTGVANKILQFMGKVRNESDISQARRWVMELLQNAGDLANDRAVKVRISISEENLCFEHTGKVFGVKDIMSIIHQVSSKNPGEGIGQFGTGFMSTYQLSEVIELDSFLHEEGMPYRKFHVTLNREGQTKEEILQAIDANIAEVNRVDEAQDEENFDPNAFNTKFTYNLNNDSSRRISRIGMDDLAGNILYILVFSEKIDSVELVYDLPDKRERIAYRRGNKKDLTGGLLEQSVFDGAIEHKMIFMEQEVMGKRLTIAAEYGENGFKKISEKTPKLFIDFPLIGGQEFPFPGVLNHVGLKPNEPRSGISLVDNENSHDSRINRQIIEKGVELYGAYLHQLTIQEYKGIENIIAVPSWEPNKEWSESWMQKNLYGALYHLVSRESFIPYEGGKISLSDASVKLIKAQTKEKRENIRSITKYIKNMVTPLSETDWFAVFEGYDLPKDKYLELNSIFENVGEYLWGKLDEEQISVHKWCVKLYETGMKDADTAMNIAAGKYAIFLSQSETDFNSKKLYRIDELFVDCDIPEILKDVSEALDKLETSDIESPLRIRKMLFNQEYQPVYDERMKKYEVDGLVNYIIRRSNRGYRVKNYSIFAHNYDTAWESAWKLLISCGPNEEMYLLSRKYWNDKMPKREMLSDARFTQELWTPAYRSVINKMCESIQKYEQLEGVISYLKFDVEGGIEWLNRLYSEIARYNNLSNYKSMNLIPNQKGTMSSAYNLYLDKVQEELKEIVEAFVDIDEYCKLKEKLVDKRINLDSWEMAAKNDKEVALQINNVVQKLLHRTSLCEASALHQEACTKLLAWIGENGELAQSYFPEFCSPEDQMKLLTPKVAVNMSNRIKKINDIFREAGIDPEGDMDDVVDIIKKGMRCENSEKNLGLQYDLEAGVIYDESDFWDLTDADREAAIRMIGSEGEKYALRYLKEKLMEQGYCITDEDSDVVKLQRGDETAAILYPDTKHYHQFGWDICVEYGTDVKDYYEVKTHTVTSKVRNLLHISNEQMIMAIKEREHYSILKMDYNFAGKNVVNCVEYCDPVLQLSKRNLVNDMEGYCWRTV